MAPDPKDYAHLTNQERMLQGFPYDPSETELVTIRLRCKSLVRQLNLRKFEDLLSTRARILKELFNPDSANGIHIEPNFRCDYGTNITFQGQGYMNCNCCILDVAPVTVGKNFKAGPGVHIYTATHPLDLLERRSYEFGKAVSIGDDVWIGGLAVILPGVQIGNGVVVAAGSVVTKNVPDNVLVAGNPAKIIKKLNDPDENISKKTPLGIDPKLYANLSQLERMKQGYPHDFTYDPAGHEARNKCGSLITEFNLSTFEDLSNRRRILKELFHSELITNNIHIEPNFRCNYGMNTIFGDNAYMNIDCCILDSARVTIGKNFRAGPGVHIYTPTHPLDKLERREYEFSRAVSIGDDVWIGGLTVILPGVQIGNGVVVAPGSVVTKDIPDNVLVAGIPAKIIKNLDKNDLMISDTPEEIREYPLNFPNDQPSFLEEAHRHRQKCRALLWEFNSSSDTDLLNRTRILKQLLSPESSSNKKIYIKPNFQCEYGYNIIMGDNAWINMDCCILDVCKVTIGKNFKAGPNVHIYTASQHADFPIFGKSSKINQSSEYDEQGIIKRSVSIGDDVWIGGRAIICPGVTIGDGVVVGAGSVVIEDVPEFVVVAGNPARVIKNLNKPCQYISI